MARFDPRRALCAGSIFRHSVHQLIPGDLCASNFLAFVISANGEVVHIALWRVLSLIRECWVL